MSLTRLRWVIKSQYPEKSVPSYLSANARNLPIGTLTKTQKNLAVKKCRVVTKKHAIKVLAKGSASTKTTRRTPTPQQLQRLLNKSMPKIRPPTRTVPLATTKTKTLLVQQLNADQEDVVEVLPVVPEAEAEAEGREDTTMTSMCS
jgi:hypothetical protein